MFNFRLEHVIIHTFFAFQNLLRLVDIPGHERVFTKYLDIYKTTCKGVMFVIDSETVETDICDVAEYEIHKEFHLYLRNYLIFIHFRLLYRILTDITLQSNKSKIIILCNKQDKLMAKGSEVIKTLLEKELYVFKHLLNCLM